MFNYRTETHYDKLLPETIIMIENRMDLLTLSRILDHSNLTLLKRYTKQLPEDLQPPIIDISL
jgi:hypothetical protein